MKLDDRTVLITGGSSGIGRALVAEFLRRDCRVVTCGRDPDKLETLKAEFHDLETVVADVARADDRNRLLKAVEQRQGSLDLLINNAGIQYAIDFLAPDADDEARIETEIAVNLTAPVQLARAAMPLLRAGVEPGIVNVSSALAIVPKKTAPLYCASKAGLHAFSLAIGYQLQAAGIQVFDVMPPLVATAMTTKEGGDKMSPQDCAAAIIAGLARDKREIHVGRVKFLLALHRFLPGVAKRMMRDQ